ncbi:MAG: sulfatase [Planctomycetota bacterium]
MKILVIPTYAILALLGVVAFTWVGRAAETASRPNLVVILVDDLGYGDLGCYGSQVNRTPNIDGLAREGLLFTNFCACASFCTPSRAALMTGCYPQRVGLSQGLHPGEGRGLNPDEFNLAMLAKSEGYATACVGKWHLGDQLPFLPIRQGFDDYFGIPYSNDMGNGSQGGRGKSSDGKWMYPPLPLIDHETVVEQEPDQSTLTDRFTERAVSFITQHQDSPFFLYLPHMDIHSKRHPPQRFMAKSGNGDYGAAVEHVDWSTGRILETIEHLGLGKKTLIVFTSDNGASENQEAGSNKPLRGGKLTPYEGGFRVPCIMKWSGRIAAGGTCRELATMMDILPTFAELTGANTDRLPTIDGKTILPLMEDPTRARSPHESFFYFHGDRLQAVRSGKWKLFVVPRAKSRLQKPPPGEKGVLEPAMQLYDLEADIGETTDVAAQNPEAVERLARLAEQCVADLSGGRKGIGGAGCRPAGTVQHPTTIDALGELD